MSDWVDVEKKVEGSGESGGGAEERGSGDDGIVARLERWTGYVDNREEDGQRVPAILLVEALVLMAGTREASGRSLLQGVAKDFAVVFNNKGIRPRSIEYRKKNAGGATATEVDQEGSVRANRICTISSS